jgi:hypothetical protein
MWKYLFRNTRQNYNYKEVEIMNTYRFRAELLADLYAFFQIGIVNMKWEKLSITVSGKFLEAEVELVAGIPIEDIRNELRKVVDGHVMVQTLALKDEYTGERNFSL